MTQSELSSYHPRRLSARLGAVLAALLCLGLLTSASASAAFEEVGNFAGNPGELHGQTGWPEEVQLGGLGGMAVNYTGAGGVPAGTIYTASQAGGVRVARYNPDRSFSESWTFAGSPEPNERCGPEGNPADPSCESHPTASQGGVDVDVDESTGNVYVFNGEPVATGENQIHVYAPDGSKLIAEFGERAPSGESTAASPNKVHAPNFATPGAIAVDASGTVYVYDQNSHEGFHRLMVFEPESAGDYEHYKYAGANHDILAGTSGIDPQRPVADAAGHLYTADEFSGRIAKVDPSQPAAPPLCEFTFSQGTVLADAVNPVGEEFFFMSEKQKGKVHQLSANCPGGKFTDAGTFSYSPFRNYFGAMAFDPLRRLEAGRPAGVLYGGSPNQEGGLSEKNPPFATESAIGYFFARPLTLQPTIEAESFGHVTATTAELSAQINPNSSATRYVFQYETEASYAANDPSERFAGALEAPLGGAFLGEGTEVLSASASLLGLAPDTAYRFRVVATSHCNGEDLEAICEATGATQALRTFPEEAPGLADHRAYELVSPAEKQGGQVLPADPSPGTCIAGVDSSEECKPGLNLFHFPMQSSLDGESIVYEGTAFDTEAAALNANQYIAHRDAQKGWQTTNLTPLQLGGRYVAFAPTLSGGVLEQQFSPLLSPDAPAERADLYSQPTANPLSLTSLLGAGQAFHRSTTTSDNFRLNYAGASAGLSRIFFSANDALTEATPFAPEAVDGGPGKNNLYEWHEGSLSLVNVLPGNAETHPGASFGALSTHAISADGNRAFFSDEAGQVYLREDGETTKEIKTEGAPDPGKFLIAATDGSAVLLANGHLHYTEGSEATVDLTQGKGGFQGVVGESEDLSRVYFVDTEVLDETSNTQSEEAEKGKDNLYSWAMGEGTRFVATLLEEDNSPDGSAIGPGYGASDWNSPDLRTAEASPDGRYLSFLSHARLTGYDNTGPSCRLLNLGLHEFAPGPCEEVFLYDMATHRLSCASCNPSGQRPLSFSILRLISGGENLPQPRYLTDTGRLYFDSRDSLVPADTNHGVEDVYQYEPDGVGTCGREAGCTSLISAGTGTSDSNFLSTDLSGKDVFFTTRDQLTLRDKDELIDLYDAREDGGIPAESEVARTECQGEACQAVITPPNDPTPGSSTFNGAGNVKEEAKAKKHHKKHKKKRHAKKRAAKRNRGGAK